MLRTLLMWTLSLTPTPVFAEGLEVIGSKSAFVSVVEGRTLARLGIKLSVSSTGDISGRAFGKEVTGQWQWREGYFCRDLNFGTQGLGPNCQIVETDGRKIRFTADRGEGDYADFTLR